MVEAILHASAEVFAELGYARTTTNKIAERAGVSVGSLYQYFPNKDAILFELLQQHHAEAHEVLEGALARLADPNTTIKEGIRHLMTDLVALHQANPALTKALSFAVLRQSPVIEELHKNKDDQLFLEDVASTLSQRSDVRVGDYPSMALVLGQATGQLCRWLVHDAPPNVPFERLLEEIIELLSRYIAPEES